MLVLFAALSKTPLGKFLLPPTPVNGRQRREEEGEREREREREREEGRRRPHNNEFSKTSFLLTSPFSFEMKRPEEEEEEEKGQS